MTAREIDALLSNLRELAIRQHLEICRQARVLDDLVVARLVEWLAKQDVLAEGRVANPRLLGAVGDRAAKDDLALGATHLAEERLQQRRLARADRADDRSERPARDLEVDVRELEHGRDVLELVHDRWLPLPIPLLPLPLHNDRLGRRTLPLERGVDDLNCELGLEVHRERLRDLVRKEDLRQPVASVVRVGDRGEGHREHHQRHTKELEEGQGGEYDGRRVESSARRRVDEERDHSRQHRH